MYDSRPPASPAPKTDGQTDTAFLRSLSRHCSAYKGAQTGPALFQLATTLALFTAATAAMVWLLQAGLTLPALLLALPAGGLLVRVFIIQHDCGHMAFFKTRRANNITGRALSLLTFTPYGYWRDAHNIHHAGSGDLARRGVGSIDTLTVAEYHALPKKKRFFYRLYRHPAIMLLVGPPLHILWLQRIPFQNSLLFIEEFRVMPTHKIWRSIVALNFALLVFYGAVIMFFGTKVALLAFLLPAMVAAWAGGWLFFIQHQFENAYWRRGESWSFQEASVLGSSYYVLPKILHWFTGNIGLHHIHHLCSLIPNYRLQACLAASTDLQNMNRMTLRQSLHCARLALWDESQGRMLRFCDLHKQPAPQHTTRRTTTQTVAQLVMRLLLVPGLALLLAGCTQPRKFQDLSMGEKIDFGHCVIAATSQKTAETATGKNSAKTIGSTLDSAMNASENLPEATHAATLACAHKMNIDPATIPGFSAKK